MLLSVIYRKIVFNCCKQSLNWPTIHPPTHPSFHPSSALVFFCVKTIFTALAILKLAQPSLQPFTLPSIHPSSAIVFRAQNYFHSSNCSNNFLTN